MLGWSFGVSSKREGTESQSSGVQKSPLQKAIVVLDYSRMQTEEVSMKVAMTMQDACQAWGIHPTLVRNLEDDGIKEFFEIQTKAIPHFLDCPSLRCSAYS